MEVVKDRKMVVEERKQVVTELKKVAADRDEWTAVKRSKSSVECSRTSSRSSRSGSSLEKVKVPVEKVSSKALSMLSEVRDLSFVWPGLGSKVRVELEGGIVLDELEGGSVVDESSLLSQKDKVRVQEPVPAVSVEYVNSITLARFRMKKEYFSFIYEVRDLSFVWPELVSKVRVKMSWKVVVCLMFV